MMVSGLAGLKAASVAVRVRKLSGSAAGFGAAGGVWASAGAGTPVSPAATPPPARPAPSRNFRRGSVSSAMVPSLTGPRDGLLRPDYQPAPGAQRTSERFPAQSILTRVILATSTPFATSPAMKAAQ